MLSIAYTLTIEDQYTCVTLVDIMALNATVLGVPLNTLATALCRFLAHIAKVHKRENHIASVAIPLGCNQRRSIIRTNQSEQEPD